MPDDATAFCGVEGAEEEPIQEIRTRMIVFHRVVTLQKSPKTC
jgi:hypothetical protein